VRVPFQEEWRLALTLQDRVRRAGIEVDLVAADAGMATFSSFVPPCSSVTSPTYSACRASSPCGSGRHRRPRARSDPASRPCRDSRDSHGSLFRHDARVLRTHVETQEDSQQVGSLFDLIIATNVLVYYDVFEQTLALADVSKMLRPGRRFSLEQLRVRDARHADESRGLH
jgi:hypothetical protein